MMVADSEAFSAGPLEGIRIIELGQLLAGSFAGRLLGDMGAEIVKVEAPRPAGRRAGAQCRFVHTAAVEYRPVPQLDVEGWPDRRTCARGLGNRAQTTGAGSVVIPPAVPLGSATGAPTRTDRVTLTRTRHRLAQIGHGSREKRDSAGLCRRSTLYSYGEQGRRVRAGRKLWGGRKGELLAAEAHLPRLARRAVLDGDLRPGDGVAYQSRDDAPVLDAGRIVVNRQEERAAV